MPLIKALKPEVSDYRFTIWNWFHCRGLCCAYPSTGCCVKLFPSLVDSPHTAAPRTTRATRYTELCILTPLTQAGSQSCFMDRHLPPAPCLVGRDPTREGESELLVCWPFWDGLCKPAKCQEREGKEQALLTLLQGTHTSIYSEIGRRQAEVESRGWTTYPGPVSILPATGAAGNTLQRLP